MWTDLDACSSLTERQTGQILNARSQMLVNGLAHISLFFFFRPNYQEIAAHFANVLVSPISTSLASKISSTYKAGSFYGSTTCALFTKTFLINLIGLQPGKNVKDKRIDRRIESRRHKIAESRARDC